jgi:hypothetical protein
MQRAHALSLVSGDRLGLGKASAVYAALLGLGLVLSHGVFIVARSKSVFEVCGFVVK